MPKNKKGGKGAKKGKNYNTQNTQLILKENEGEEYGIVKSKNGNGRFTIYCYDDVERIGIIRGKDRKRKWVNLEDIVLVEKWNFETDGNKCTILHTYDKNDENKLLKNNEINFMFLKKNKNTNDFNSTDNDYEDDIFQRDYTIDDSEEDQKSNSSDSESEDSININDI
jgi:translation initiation factor 1A